MPRALLAPTMPLLAIPLAPVLEYFVDASPVRAFLTAADARPCSPIECVEGPSRSPVRWTGYWWLANY